MSQCFGDIPVGTKVDREMSAFLDQRANERGMSLAELHRRLLDHYRESRAGELECPHCGDSLYVEL